MRPSDVRHRRQRHAALRRLAALVLAAAAAILGATVDAMDVGGALAPPQYVPERIANRATTQQIGSWRLEQGSPADLGSTGARWPALSADGLAMLFSHDGNLPAQGGPGNPDVNTEIWVWRGAALEQITATSRTDGSTPVQSRPSASIDGNRVAFLSTGDLNGSGSNADHSPEVWVWDVGLGFTQVTASASGAGQGPAIAANGQWVVFWYTGDLTGTNPDGGLELYVAQVSGPIHQLTALTGSPYHDLPSITANGAAVAFIVQADLTGANADGSWELFEWVGPPTTPGDPSRFVQVTDWAPPLTGREIYHPSIGRPCPACDATIAFAGRGQVDKRLTETHTELEIYLWTGGRVERLTRATSANASSLLPQISTDGMHVAFVSLSDFAPGAPGNPERNQELFVWSECGPIAQVSAGRDRGGIVANVPEVAPPANDDGTVSGFISETVADPHPIALTSRRGILFGAVEDPTSPCPHHDPAPTPDSSPTPPAPTPTTTRTPAYPSPTAGPVATATPAGLPQVCPQVAARIPSAVQARALTQPEAFYGWNLPANPGVPPGPTNPRRRWLSIRDPGKPFSPANSAVWKVGCP